MPSGQPYADDEDSKAIADGTAKVLLDYQRQEAAFLIPFQGFADELLASVQVVTDANSRECFARLLVSRLS